MIRATSLPEFEIDGDLDAPLPEAAVEALAKLLLDFVDDEDGSSEAEEVDDD